ncbi:GFA family protein [Erythrobacter sp. Alg231-14]|uniref:GFA family protein n=1 Tax=Erythrobacter sp. Alg231-14 TaxID=1922225 RepID=UPI000D556954
MEANCHCGLVSITLDTPPDFINLCDCTLCLKSGAAWGYFASEQVQVLGRTSGYQRVDYDNAAVEVQFCPKCGSTTHWVLTESYMATNKDGDRMGVNMRLFDPAELSGIEGRTLDGRNWFGDTAAAHRRPPGKIGTDLHL